MRHNRETDTDNGFSTYLLEFLPYFKPYPTTTFVYLQSISDVCFCYEIFEIAIVK